MGLLVQRKRAASNKLTARPHIHPWRVIPKKPLPEEEESRSLKDVNQSSFLTVHPVHCSL
jgi:hypothetical protein